MKLHSLSRFVALGVMSLSLLEALAGEMKVDPEQSSVEVAVKATGDDFVARLVKFDSKIEANETNGVPRSATITWNFKDLKTGNKSRDKEMLHWLEQNRFPTARFTLKSCSLQDGKWVGSGDLEMHGVSKGIVFPLSIRRDGAHIVYSATISLDHRNFGLERIVKFLVLKVDPLLSVHFELMGKVERQGAVERE
ncbi:MAG: YceI family protein [Limisphaerales bacterium]